MFSFRNTQPTPVAPKVKLTTPIGALLDKASYGTIGLIIATIIISSAFYYYATESAQDISNIPVGWWDSIYFSIITFSSLGYGDIHPIGSGKFLASTEVILGLITIAVFVGKIASERQATLLLLLYTSEQQRRITDFEKEAQRFCATIESALENHDNEKLLSIRNNLYSFISGIYKYLNYQSIVAGLADYGNDNALRGLYQELLNLQNYASEVVRTYKIEQKTQNKFEQIVRRLSAIGFVMRSYHQDDNKASDTLNKLQEIANNIHKWKESDKKNIHDFKYRSNTTPEL